MPKSESPGTENLRADAHVYTGSTADSPSGAGTDAGGTENLKETTTTKSAAGKTVGTYAKDSRPAGVDTFKEGL
jgi:hypothetical protein